MDDKCGTAGRHVDKVDAWLRENAPDCGDNSCLFGGRGKGGMRTNGGCRCFKDLPTAKRIYVERLFAASVTRSAGTRIDAQWCMDTFWRINPGGNAAVPSLYLLDFAREVLRVFGTPQSASEPFNCRADDQPACREWCGDRRCKENATNRTTDRRGVDK